MRTKILNLIHLRKQRYLSLVIHLTTGDKNIIHQLSNFLIPLIVGQASWCDPT